MRSPGADIIDYSDRQLTARLPNDSDEVTTVLEEYEIVYNPPLDESLFEIKGVLGDNSHNTSLSPRGSLLGLIGTPRYSKQGPRKKWSVWRW